MNNEEVLQEFEKYLKREGRKAKWCAEEVQMSQSMISKWRKQIRFLSQDSLIKINNLINR